MQDLNRLSMNGYLLRFDPHVLPRHRNNEKEHRITR
jgi:hypothetical protein